MAVVALIAVGLTQNKPLPENVKVTQTWGVQAGVPGEGKEGYGKLEHTGGVEVLASQEQINIYWIREVKWKWCSFW